MFDVNAAAMQPLVARGAVAARSAREAAAGAEIVFACLPSPEVSKSVALGARRHRRGRGTPRLRRNVHDRHRRDQGDRRRARRARHHRPRRAGQRRAARRARRQARHHGGGRPRGVRPRPAALRRDRRQGLLRRRGAGARADHEAREQHDLGRRDGGGDGGRGDGGESRRRRAHPDRRGEREHRPQHRDHGQVPAVDPAAHLRLRRQARHDVQGRRALLRGGARARRADVGRVRPSSSSGSRR